jgi:hypothetical protein
MNISMSDSVAAADFSSSGIGVLYIWLLGGSSLMEMDKSILKSPPSAQVATPPHFRPARY